MLATGIGLGLLALIVFIVVVVFVIVLIIGALLFLLPATIVGGITWIVTGSFLAGVIAFIIVAILVKLARRR